MKYCLTTFCNKNFLSKTEQTIAELRTKGQYDDKIILMVGDDLKHYSLNDSNVVVKYFPTIDRSSALKRLNGISTSDGRDFNKSFQWHKIYTFHPFFKEWDSCMLIDGGMRIYNPIWPMVELDCSKRFLAHCDGYPTYEWKLSCQFESNRFADLYNDLSTNYNLDIDYFQTGMYYFDTSIFEDSMIERLLHLGNTYINTRTNEQAIMNLIINCEKKLWSQIQLRDDNIHYYDCMERNGLHCSNYIMLKMPQTN
jgi:hypothetical protein